MSFTIPQVRRDISINEREESPRGRETYSPSLPGKKVPLDVLNVHQNNEATPSSVQVYQKTIFKDLEYIRSVYDNLKDHQVIDISGISQAITRFERVQLFFRVISEIIKCDNTVSSDLKSQIEECLPKVKVLTNLNSYQLSSQLSVSIIKQIGNFFTRPGRLSYIDPGSKVEYFKPNHSELLQLGHLITENGGYAAIGVLVSAITATSETFQRIHPLTNSKENCDILYFVKHSDQIEHDNEKIKQENECEDLIYDPPSNKPSRKSFTAILTYMISFVTGNRLESRIREQNLCLSDVQDEYSNKYKDWNYSSVFVFTKCKEMIKAGFLGEAARTQHAIVLFHKRKIKRNHESETL